MLPPNQPITHRTPREILAADFPSLEGGLPISGGWGFSKADACIIEKNDPLVDPSMPFHGVGIEHVFVEKRIYEELIIRRKEDERFSGISWELQMQKLIHDDGRIFDMLEFEVSAYHDIDWEELKAEFEGEMGYGHPDFDIEVHEKKRQEKMVTFTREFWFDISSFYGQEIVVTSTLPV